MLRDLVRGAGALLVTTLYAGLFLALSVVTIASIVGITLMLGAILGVV